MIVSRIWGLVAKRGVGVGEGTEPEFGSDGGSIEGGEGLGVGCEEVEDVVDEVGVSGVGLLKDGCCLGERVAESEAEGGFDLLVAFWRHVASGERECITRRKKKCEARW